MRQMEWLKGKWRQSQEHWERKECDEMCKELRKNNRKEYNMGMIGKVFTLQK